MINVHVDINTEIEYSFCMECASDETTVKSFVKLNVEGVALHFEVGIGEVHTAIFEKSFCHHF